MEDSSQEIILDVVHGRKREGRMKNSKGVEMWTIEHNRVRRWSQEEALSEADKFSELAKGNKAQILESQ